LAIDVTPAEVIVTSPVIETGAAGTAPAVPVR